MEETKLEKLARLSGKATSKALDALRRNGPPRSSHRPPDGGLGGAVPPASFVLADAGLGSRLPGNEDLSTRCDEARNETLRTQDKEVVEACLEHRTEPTSEIRS